nr:vomeronasal type-1 receptor 1-like [Peromyscus maniculatus bairdii]
MAAKSPTNPDSTNRTWQVSPSRAAPEAVCTTEVQLLNSSYQTHLSEHTQYPRVHSGKIRAFPGSNLHTLHVSIAASCTLENAIVQNVFFRSMSSITDAFLKESLHPGHEIFYLGKEEMVLKFIKEIVFIFMTILGTLGNISVSVNYMFIWWGGPERKPIHLILIHLAFANIMILLAKGLPKTIAAFGLRNFLDDIGCKIIVYLERVARGLSICTSSLLTVVQAIIISPRASGWRRLRPKSAWHILPFFSFFWILNEDIKKHLFTPDSVKTVQRIGSFEVVLSEPVSLDHLGTSSFIGAWKSSSYI